MERKTALSRQGILNTYDALKYNGIIYLVGESKLGTNNYTINTGCFPSISGGQPALLVNPLDQSTHLTSSGQPALPEVVNPLDHNHTLTIQEPSTARLKTDETKGKYQLQGIEAAMFGDRPVTEQDLPVWEIREKDAISAFESALGIPANWNWYPAKSTEEPTWRDFRKFLVEKYEADPQAFTRYNTWRNQPYVRGAMSNTDIKRFPGNFPTSWSDFEGTAKSSEPKSQTVTTDKHGIVESW